MIKSSALTGGKIGGEIDANGLTKAGINVRGVYVT
jgi:hypothetical protein